MADLNKIRQAFPEFKDTSDAELIGQISKMTRTSTGEISDLLGIAPRGTLAESARQFAGGLVSDLPRMFGKAVQYVVPETSQAGIDARGLVSRAEARGIGYEPDLRGRGLGGEIAVKGARGVGAAVPLLAASAVPGVGPALSAGIAAPLFGLSSAQDTYEKILEQTGDKEAATAAARRVGVVQGLGEAAATFVGGKALQGIAPVFGAGSKTTGGVLAGMTDTAVLKPFAKSMAINAAVQPATEVAQDLGTYAVEQAYGAKAEDPYAIARESAIGGLGMSLWLGPLSLGGHRARAKKAEQFSLAYNEAMYGENATPESRSAALQAVVSEAKRQGVKVDDAEQWMQRQLREEAGVLDDLKKREDAVVEAGKESPLADISYALTDPELADKISDTDRQSLIGLLDTVRLGNLPPAAEEAVITQAQGIIGRYMVAEQDQNTEVNLLQTTGLQTTPALFAPTPVEEIDLAGGLTQVQTNLPADTSAYAPDMNVGREMPRTQQPAPVEGAAGISTVAPGVFEVAQPLQQVETTPAATAAPAATPVADTTAQTTAAPTAFAPTSTKTSTQGLTTNTYTATDAQDSPVTVNVTRGVTGRVTRAEVVRTDSNGKVTEKRTLTNFGQSALTPTDAAFLQATLPDFKFGAPAPVSPLAEQAAPSPSAPPAGGIFPATTTATQNGAQTTQAKQTETQGQKPATAAAVTAEADTGPKNVSEAIKEDNKNDAILKAIEAENEKTDNLFADVTGDKKKAPGKPSMPSQVYAAIRNAVLNPKGAIMVRKAKSVDKDVAATEKYGAKVKQIADAVIDLANAYETYTKQNLVRSGETIKRGVTGDEVMDARATELKANANAVRAALAKLGEAVDGNAKDVEAIVRFIKDRAQNEQKGNVEAGKTDIRVSRAWAAAKSEAFIGEPDLLATSSNEVRQSKEGTARGAVPQLVTAVTEGYQVLGKGEKQTGLNGILNYIRTNGTPFEKTLAQAIKLAVKGKAPITIKFVKEGKSQYDPKTNTITINETSSKEVALHEALHGALQWFVYTNPNAAQVVALKAALQRVVNFDTAKLTPKAAEVQAVLKKVLAGKSKTAELDAVLELISYGNTLNDFRRALQGMESNAPRTFVKFTNDVMEAIYALVRRMLGVKQSVASDVIENTLQLLEAAREATQEAAPKKGNVLQAAVDTTTDAFKRWFGDSKVVGEDGKPLVVYHGTLGNYDTFKLSPEGALGAGIYTTPSAEFAGTYADTSNLSRADAAKDEASGQNIMPLYVSIKNPIILEQGRGDPMVAALVKLGMDQGKAEALVEKAYEEKGYVGKQVMTRAMAQGYDGILQYGRDGKLSEVVAFKPTQVKSATGNSGAFDPTSGNILKADVQSEIPNPAQQSDQMNLEKYKDTPGWSVNLTRSFLEQVGFGEGGKVDKTMRGWMDKAADKIVTEFPGVTSTLRKVSSSFGLNTEYTQAASVSKQEKQGGLVEAESLMQRLYRSPADAVRVFSYLNGDNNALQETGRDAVLRDTADSIKEHIDSYIETLAPKDKRMFEGLKFTDKLLKPEGLADLAKKSFGMHSVSAIFRPEDRVDPNIDDFKNLLPMTNGVIDSDKPLFQTFETLGGQRLPNGFISEEKANDHPELDIDRSRVWYFDGKKNGPNGGFKFRTRNISGANLIDVAKRMGDPNLSTQEKEEAAQQISSAMLTTIAALSHNSATKNLFASMEPMGRNEDKSATESTVVFNSVDEINSVFPNRKLTEKNLLQAAADESDIDTIRKEAQRGDVWVKLPDTAHYGPLRGKIISGGVWSNLLDMHERQPILRSRILNETMAAFKKNKTVFSPATHANNILTNYSLMLLHGISHKAIGDAANLLVRYEANPGSLTEDQRALMKAFYKSGAVLGNFTNAETKTYLAQKLAQNITQKNDRSLLTKLSAWAGYEQEFSKYASKLARGAKLTDSAFSEVYAAGDNVFRLAAFLNVAGNLQAKNDGVLGDAQLKEAGLAARKMFLDYDIDSRAVKFARQTALPFISWSYAITPVLGRLAITKPWTMINMMAALYAMGMMGDDDEWRKTGPKAVRERSLWGMGPYKMIRIPFMGDDENPMYYNIGKSIPMMSLFEPAQGNAKLGGFDWIPGVLQPSGPYVTLLANTLLNVDPFTGKPIYNETDDNLDKAMKSGKAVWDTFAPAPLTFRTGGQVMDWAQDKEGPTGKPNDGLVFARLFGLSVYQYNEDETKYYQDAEVKKIKSEFKKVMNQAKRDEYSKGYPDYDALDAKLEKLSEGLEKRIAEIRGDE
jgi:hypothetical protein